MFNATEHLQIPVFFLFFFFRKMIKYEQKITNARMFLVHKSFKPMFYQGIIVYFHHVMIMELE